MAVACLRADVCWRTGQLEYIAPEVLSKPRAEDIFHEVLFNGMSEEELPQYNEKADIWSTGVVIYEALTGLQPFPAETAKELAEMQACKLGGGECSGGDKGSFPAFIQDTRLTAHAQSFLNSMLQADPAQRSSAEQLLQHPWVHPIIPPAGQTMQLRASPLVITGPMHVPVR
ncbi:protein kinase domain-containing protein [Haematococcus lacustris]|uniref:Protein kinase domain-containing protein n=1 Tax=Haematococcus lacustris TaxID=44745 RepID=A0A699YUE1_HAELA|nr:protein kinase domain-containing protein [Haematococcus lacustris]